MSYKDNPKPVSELCFRSKPFGKYVFHGCCDKDLDSIATNGLGNVMSRDTSDSPYDGIYRQKGFFFTTDLGEACAYGESVSSGPCAITVIAIPTEHLDFSKVYLDDTYGDYADDFVQGKTKTYNCTSFFYAGVIDNPKETCYLVE